MYFVADRSVPHYIFTVRYKERVISEPLEHRVRDIAALGTAIRKARKAQGLTQQEFADIAGVGVRFLSELERGKETAEVGLVLHVVELAGFNVILEAKGRRPSKPDA